MPIVKTGKGIRPIARRKTDRRIEIKPEQKLTTSTQMTSHILWPVLSNGQSINLKINQYHKERLCFIHHGKVSPALNFIPDEVYGAKAISVNDTTVIVQIDEPQSDLPKQFAMPLSEIMLADNKDRLQALKLIFEAFEFNANDELDSYPKREVYEFGRRLLEHVTV